MPTQATAKTSGRILVVDDDLVVRDSLVKWFCSEGHLAQPAASAYEALEAIQRVEYDLAVIDIQMPGMDGMELQGRLREIRPDLGVIVVTGFPSEDTAAQAFQLGASAYVTKPVDPDDLSHLVADALERRRAGGKTAECAVQTVRDATADLAEV
jgi:DNA-binding NtrC family response regulator